MPGVANSKGFPALIAKTLGSAAKRRFAVSLSGAIAIGLLATQPAAPAPAAPLHLTTIPAATSPWLDRFNAWRASTGLPAVTEDPTWSAGDAAHALYMVKNNAVTHYELSTLPYYTAAGDTAARNSNIQVSSTTATTDSDAIDWWMGAPFHAIGMMDPRLTTVGFGSYREVKSGWDEGAAVDVLHGNPWTGGTYPVFFPGNGTTEPLTTYSGGEFPDPLSACSGYAVPTGLPVVIQVGGNVATSVTAHSFTGNGTPLAHCVIDSNTPNIGSDLTGRGGVIIVPRQPLQNGVRYAVAVTVNGTPYTWSFTVGPFFGVTGVTPDSGPAAGATAVTLTGTGFTGATGVNFGATAATAVTVVNDSTITAVSPAHAAGTVDVTVTKASGPSLTSSSDRFTYAPCAAVTDSASPTSPAASGTPITVTGSASGCGSSNPLYEFWMLPSGSTTWNLVQGYSANASYAWNSTGALAGTEQFGVWVRDAASLGVSCNPGMGCYDAFAGIPYSVTVGGVGGSACASITGSSSPASPVLSGTPVTISGAASGCPNPRYEFWMKAGANAWQLVQGYSPSPTYAWNSTGALAGTETFGVWTRDASSTASYDTYASVPFTVTTASCGSVTATAAPATAAHGTGAHITITGAGAGCSNPRYEFWMKAAGSTRWQLLQGYSTSATYAWNTTGALAGTETFGVWVRDASSGASYDSYASLAVTLT